MNTQIDLKDYPELSRLIAGYLSVDEGFDETICGFVYTVTYVSGQKDQRIPAVVQEISTLLNKGYPDQALADFLDEGGCIYLLEEGAYATLKHILDRLHPIMHTRFPEILCFFQIFVSKTCILEQSIAAYIATYAPFRIEKAISELETLLTDGEVNEQASTIIVASGCENLIAERSTKDVLTHLCEMLKQAISPNISTDSV